jgi:hypothetical protein
MDNVRIPILQYSNPDSLSPKWRIREANRICFLYLIEGSGCFFHDKMIAPVFLMGRGLFPPRKAKHGAGSCWSESFK